MSYIMGYLIHLPVIYHTHLPTLRQVAAPREQSGSRDDQIEILDSDSEPDERDSSVVSKRVRIWVIPGRGCEGQVEKLRSYDGRCEVTTAACRLTAVMQFNFLESLLIDDPRAMELVSADRCYSHYLTWGFCKYVEGPVMWASLPNPS